ncbi:MAG: formylglycine-generating enzyme family protein [Phycisphaerales bacterium]|nr:formylglycine-generating enzyme family protein [Phycisphaerales bacterium]
MVSKSIFSVVACAAFTGLGASVASAQVAIEFRTVGNAGNAGDPGNPTSGPLGAVAYEYRIGAFEVTNAQYAAFLNAVAASDPRGLFNANMGTDPRGGITRSGTTGSFTYTVRPNMGNKPVNFVSSLDALRMANWLTNGQGSGSTESGAYTLNGNTVTAITRDLSNPNQVFLPTRNEWYKAALHQPASQGGDTDNFWKFATQSNDFPIVGTATATGDIANPSATTVNWQRGADWNGQNGNVTTVGSCLNSSFYGAFDMNGNVQEWLQDTSTLGGLNNRFIAGGTFFAVPTFGILPEDSFPAPPLSEDSATGFRFASPALPPCRADFNGVEGVTLNDIFDYLNAWFAGNTSADFNGVGGLTVEDLFDYLNAWFAGC